MKPKYIKLSNYRDKIKGCYREAFRIYYDKPWFRFVNQLCDIINHNFSYMDNEFFITIEADQIMINKYSLPFDEMNLIIYKSFNADKARIRSFYEYIENIKENTPVRQFNVYLYFTENDLLCDMNIHNPLVKHCILKEMNNCFSKDLKEYIEIENALDTAI